MVLKDKNKNLKSTFSSAFATLLSFRGIPREKGAVFGRFLTAITLLQQQFDFVAVRDDSRTYNTKKSRPASKTAFVFIIELSYATGELIF
jgi:hypothetical protein